MSKKLSSFLSSLADIAKVSARATKIYARQAPWIFAAHLFVLVFEVVVGLGQLYFGAQVIQGLVDFLADTSIDREAVLRPLFYMLGLRLFAELANQILGYFRKLSYWINRNRYVLDFHKASTNLSFEQHEDNEFLVHKNKVWERVDYLAPSYFLSVMNVVHAFISIFSVAIILGSLNLLLVLIIPFFLIPNLIYETISSKIQWNSWKSSGNKHRLWWRTTYYLSNEDKLFETKVFGTARYLLDKISGLMHAFNTEQRKNYERLQKYGLLGRIFSVAGMGVVELWLLLKVLARTGFNVGDYSFFSGAISRYSYGVSLLATSLSKLFEDTLYMQDYFDYIDTKPALEVPKYGKKIAKNKIPTIEFKDVHFSYKGSDVPVFKGLNLKIEPKQKIALVGENGAGKSTLVKLLLRFYDVDKGEILVNGINIKELDLDEYYRHIGVLFQQFNDYPYQVGENIGLGRVKDVKKTKKIKEAAKLAGADSFINEYPEKYDQYLEREFENGIKPSGGQWQRLALARAFFRDAGILILDEPTAAVDANAEYEIFENIKRTQESKTTIIISHRFSTVRNADVIYVINGGEIVEQGSHADLMKNKKLYAQMFDRQAEGYK